MKSQLEAMQNASKELSNIYAMHCREKSADPTRYLIFRVKEHIDKELASMLRGKA